jgi:RNA polymerase sigma-70 factor (ECF subfamily)
MKRSTIAVAEITIPPEPLQVDDATLLRLVAAQDRPAFDILYARYAPRLRRYLAHLLNDPALAEEVCHDVMLVMWQQAVRFPATIPLFAWLCGIARHKARKAWARSSRQAQTPAVAGGKPPEVPEDRLLHQESSRRLMRAVDALPCHERTAMVLLMQHGYSYQDIATVLDTPVSTVRTRVSRACHRLRRLVTTLDVAPSPQHPSRLSAGRTGRRVHRPLLQVR